MAESPPIGELHLDEAPKITTSIPGPRSQELLDRQEAIDSSAVAYPKSVPVAFKKGRGATVEDADGNIFLDFFAGIGVLNVGHSNPYVLDGVQEQLGDLTHTIDFPSEPRLDLIEKLNEIAPGALPDNNRVVFGGPTGSDAIEATIKLAKHNTGNDGLIAFRGSYHGGSTGALSLTGGNKYKKNYTPLLPEVHHAPYPYSFQQECPPESAVDRAIEDVREILEDPYSGFANPAGIWVEAIQGEGGIITPPDEFLPRLGELASRHEIPLIVDEIQTGFGRTGEWFATSTLDVTPDIIPMAKGIGGIGLPLSATMYRENLDTWGPGGHVGTFRGHVPAMVGGIRAIEYIQDHDLLRHARNLGAYIHGRLEEVAEDVPEIGEIRGKGLFIGVEFVGTDATSAGDIVSDIQQRCYERGVLVWTAGRESRVLRLIPPLVLTEKQAETGTEIIARAIEDAAGMA